MGWRRGRRAGAAVGRAGGGVRRRGVAPGGEAAGGGVADARRGSPPRLLAGARRFGRQQGLAQAVVALPEDAGDLHLGDADGVRDLLLGLFLVEPQTEDPLVAGWQEPYHGGQGRVVDDAVESGVLGADEGGERGAVLLVHRCVQGPRAALVHRPQRGAHPLVVEARVPRDLLAGRRPAAVPLLQFLDASEDLAARLVQRARQPHGGCAVAQVPPQLPGDLGQRVRQERVAQRGVVAVDGLDQTEDGDLGEIVGILSAAPVAARHAAGERQQQPDHPVPQGGPPRAGRLGRHLAQQRVEVVRGGPRRGGAVRRPRLVGGWGAHEPSWGTGTYGGGRTDLGDGRTNRVME